MGLVETPLPPNPHYITNVPSDTSLCTLLSAPSTRAAGIIQGLTFNTFRIKKTFLMNEKEWQKYQRKKR